ncbi:MAG: glycosyltransferase, partial [Treponema sp.]|nr:glycosyltransferase [Treponema sp.]
PKDSTMDIVRSIKDPRIRIIENEKNMGIAFSRNRGLEEACGEYIALMDHDDLCPLNRFEIESTFLDSHADIDVVGGACAIIDEFDNILKEGGIPWHTPFRNKAELIFVDTVANGSAMFRTSFIKNNNLSYKDNCLGMEDYMFWVEASKYGKITNLDDVLLLWRDSQNNETKKNIENKKIERAQKYSEIQAKALEINGISLTADELSLFCNVFAEGKTEKETFETLQNVYKVLQKIMAQSETQENSKEIKQACRFHFLKRVGHTLFEF